MTPSCDFFFFNDTATTEIYTLSLHDALPIWRAAPPFRAAAAASDTNPSTWTTTTSGPRLRPTLWRRRASRSEEHTSELQSRPHLVCRLLLEKKKRQHLRAARAGRPCCDWDSL